MNIIKRSGQEMLFDVDKIVEAIKKANKEVEAIARISDEQIMEIAKDVEFECQRVARSVGVEEIQDMVENRLMNIKAFVLARKYITYRYARALVRKSNTTDAQILSLIDCNNEEVKQENSNKNPTVNSVQRDYMAGEVSKDLTRRILLPDDIVSAHDQGIIHFHDADYFAQHMHNCDLVNLEDMLQNGTVISGTLIEKPHSFSTACNISTQIIAQVASNQYGGQSISLTHLAPFVDISRKKIQKEVTEELAGLGITDQDHIVRIAEKRLRDEVRKGIQMIQYQVVTLLTTNGQAPFVTVFMYLNEARNEREKADLALIIEETLKQRIQGVKNEEGVYMIDQHAAQERINYELMKLFGGSNCSKVLLEMDEFGILEELFPSVKDMKKVPPNTHHHLDLFHHVVETVRNIEVLYFNAKEVVKDHLDTTDFGGFPRINHLKLAGFLHDIGKPECKTRRYSKLYKREVDSFFNHNRKKQD
mgnify:CR=1 FL=1